jgi:hypothetical protein
MKVIHPSAMYREYIEIKFSVPHQFGCDFTILVIFGSTGLFSVHVDPLCSHVQRIHPNKENIAA